MSAAGDFSGRTAVVTGGGRGIGSAVARALAAAGAHVIVTARTVAEIEETAGGIRDEGNTARAVPCDVANPESVDELARQAADAGSRVDILINSAGVASSAPLGRTSLELWNQMLTVNATGTFLCMRAFVDGMVENGWGRVVNLASVAGLAGGKYIAAYTAAKHAVIGLTRSVAAEVGEAGVTVNAICPGYVDTPMTDEGARRISERTGKSRDDALAAMLATTSQSRLIQPEEVAHAVLALCHEDARGINGQTIVIDGGGLLA